MITSDNNSKLLDEAYYALELLACKQMNSATTKQERELITTQLFILLLQNKFPHLLPNTPFINKGKDPSSLYNEEFRELFSIEERPLSNTRVESSTAKMLAGILDEIDTNSSMSNDEEPPLQEKQAPDRIGNHRSSSIDYCKLPSKLRSTPRKMSQPILNCSKYFPDNGLSLSKTKLSSSTSITDTNSKENSTAATPEVPVISRKKERRASTSIIKRRKGSTTEIKRPPKQKKATSAIEELLVTEQGFISSLELLLTNVYKPLQACSILPMNTVRDIFLNLDNVFKFHQDEIYNKLRKDNSLRGILGAFSSESLLQLERLYTVYIGYYEKAQVILTEKLQSNTQLKRLFNKASKLIGGKSIPNLLVIPVQRVCKYELLLKAVVKEHKQQSQYDTYLCNLVVAQAEKFSKALLAVDKKRAAADKWELLMNMEKSMDLLNPLAKLGRSVLFQHYYHVQTVESKGEELSKLVIFNDMILRAQIKKGKKSQVREEIQNSKLLLFECSTRYNNDDNFKIQSNDKKLSNYVIISSIDPRGDVWRVRADSEEKLKQLLNHGTTNALNFSTICKNWGIKARGNTENKILGVDICKLQSSYIRECKVVITSSHLCFCWQQFGFIEREVFPMESLGLIIRKNRKGRIDENGDCFEIATKTWHQSLKVSNLLNPCNTYKILFQQIQYTQAQLLLTKRTIQRCFSSKTVIDTEPLVEINLFKSLNLFDSAKVQLYATGKAIISMDRLNDHLFKLETGSIQVERKNGSIEVKDAPQLFGLKSLLLSQLSECKVTAIGEGATISSISKQAITAHIDNETEKANFLAYLCLLCSPC